MLDENGMKSLEMMHPDIVRNAKEIRMDTDSTIFIRTRDGLSLLYDIFDESIRMLPSDGANMTDMQWRMEFAFRLKRIMRLRNMSGNDLSDITGINRTSISHYLTGRSIPNFQAVDRIARALNCSIDDLRYIER